MNSKAIVFFVASMAAGTVAGCMGRSSSNLPVYDRNQIGQVISEQRGEVISVRDVLIKAPTRDMGSTGVGSRIGAASAVGILSGSPSAVIGAVGSVVGAAAGARVGDDRMGEEITVLVEGGRSIIIVQERDGPPIAIGDRVKIQTGSGGSIYSGSSAKVVRDPQFAATF